MKSKEQILNEQTPLNMAKKLVQLDLADAQFIGYLTSCR